MVSGTTDGASHEEPPIPPRNKRSPFEAMFGRKLALANEDGNMPTDEERGLNEEAVEEEVCLLFE